MYFVLKVTKHNTLEIKNNCTEKRDDNIKQSLTHHGMQKEFLDQAPRQGLEQCLQDATFHKRISQAQHETFEKDKTDKQA